MELFVVSLVVVSSTLGVEGAAVTSFDAWVDQYELGPYSSPEERSRRADIWAGRLSAHGPHGLSPYSDRTAAELAAIFPPQPLNAGPKPAQGYPFHTFSDGFVAKALAAGVDWRARGAVTPVKSQGSHGVCGTFGQVQDAESQYFLGGGGANPAKTPRPLTQFSEMQLLACKTAEYPSDAAVLMGVGAEPATDYPFNQSNWPDRDPPPCKADLKKILPGSKPSNTTTVPKSAGEDQLAAMVFHNGPMQVGINDNILHLKDANAHISADVCQKNPLKGINHSLGVVGFNTTAANGAYWIIKNSWSQKWGDHGFVYLARGVACGNVFASGAHVYTYGDPAYYYEQ